MFTPTRGILLSDEQDDLQAPPTENSAEIPRPDSITRPPQGKGIFSSIASSLAHGFLRAGTSAYNLVQGVGDLGAAGIAAAAGQKGTANRLFRQAGRDASATRDVPFFGKTTPVGFDDKGNQMSTGDFAKDVIGTGLEIGSNIVGGGAAGKVGAATLRGAVFKGAKAGIVDGALAGGSNALGLSLQDTEKTAGETALNTIGGTVAGGLLGGVVGSALPTVGAGLRGIYKKIAAPVKDTLTSAIKPAKNIAGATFINSAGKEVNKWSHVMDTALPDIAATVNKNQAAGEGIQAITGADDLVTITRDAKKGIWKEVQEVLGRHAELDIEGDSISTAIKSAITTRMRRENSPAIKSIENMADAYKGKVSIDDAETILEELNQELGSFYRKSPQSKYQSASDPNLLADLKLADALRNGIEDVLNRASGSSVKGLKARYGALTEFLTQVEGRRAVANNAQPFNIPEQMQIAEGAAGVVDALANGGIIRAGAQLLRPLAATALKDANTMDAQIARAFSKYMKKTPKGILGVGTMPKFNPVNK